MLDNALIALTITTMRTGLADVNLGDLPILQTRQPTQQGVNTDRSYYFSKIMDRMVGFPKKDDTWGQYDTASFTASISGTVMNVTSMNSGAIEVGHVVTGTGIPANTIISSQGTGTGQTGTYNISQNLSLSSRTLGAYVLAMVHTETQQYETTFQISALATQNPADTASLTASDLLNYARYALQSQPTIATLEAAGVGILDVGSVRNPAFADDRDQNEFAPSFDFVLTHKQIIVTTTPILQSEEFQILSV